MKKKHIQRTFFEHFLTIVIVGSLFSILMIGVRQQQDARGSLSDPEVETYLELDFLNFNNHLHRALFKETLNVFFPDTPVRNDSLVAAIERYRKEHIANLQKQQYQEGLTGEKLLQLLPMYLSFILVYVLVMGLTYYGVQTLAIFRFVKMKQQRSSYLAELVTYLRRNFSAGSAGKWAVYLGKAALLFGKALFKGMVTILLFSPAYVIAYSFKTRFDTDSFFFMVVLGVVSNGLLIHYAQKFYTFLLTESRRGYVETAVVKNLNNDYFPKSPRGISSAAIWSLRKQFPGHVFQHIYLNARQQYIATLKEQASFLITGLVIIEMALNIQGHLCYEMLQNVLYQNYDIVLVIILGIFMVVKLTEMFTDYWMYLEAKRYENS